MKLYLLAILGSILISGCKGSNESSATVEEPPQELKKLSSKEVTWATVNEAFSTLEKSKTSTFDLLKDKPAKTD